MKPPRVELVYFPGCPNAGAARKALRSALKAEGLAPEWREWNCGERTTPPELRRFGSPTVLVNGNDIAPAPAQGECCRVYGDKDGLHGAPGVKAVRVALRRAMGTSE